MVKDFLKVFRFCYFQFPLLGFLLCIFVRGNLAEIPIEDAFQFPLLGFLLCITGTYALILRYTYDLSIPFIGIFALHLTAITGTTSQTIIFFQFPLLGFLLCIRNKRTVSSFKQQDLSIPFIGIFALHL